MFAFSYGFPKFSFIFQLKYLLLHAYKSLSREKVFHMCGRFALALPPKSLAEYFQLDQFPELIPRYNIAPAQPVTTIVNDKNSNRRVLKMFRWGLIPSWAKDTKIGSKLINARSETVADRPSFRLAFRNRRCLIPATGFYEWKRYEGKNQPHFIAIRDNKPFAFAGLWEHWEGRDTKIDTCTILTTEPNDVVRHIHHRMPVILKTDDYDLWLDPANTKKEVLLPLLVPCPSDLMTSYPVSTMVNNPQNDDPRCIEPIPGGNGDKNT